MTTLILIGLVGVFAYHSAANGNEFKGSSEGMKLMLTLGGTIGYIAFVALIIASFWHYAWWLPIVTMLAVIFVVAPITSPIFQRNLFGIIISPIAVVVCASLAIAGLI